jgi:hypothetical protein
MEKDTEVCLRKWLTSGKRSPSHYKFAVVDVAELATPDDEMLDFLGEELLIAHGTPKMIHDECRTLIEEAEENKLDIIKKYVEKWILPSREYTTKTGDRRKNPTWFGNFGEVLAARHLIEFEGFWLPIYKLRFREKKDWATRLTDLCIIKRDGLSEPIVCYGEVKTKSVGCSKKLAVEGHCSLAKDDALSNPEILHFIGTLFYEMGKLAEARFLSDIKLEKISYNKKHVLFLVHNKKTWRDEILDNLQDYELDDRLVDFTVNVVLIADLGKVIESAYDRAWKSAREIVDG